MEPEHQSTTSPRACPECGDTFQTKNPKQICCSRRCAQVRQYRRFKESGRYGEFKRAKREQAARLRSFSFSNCPYASGDIRMPDGGRMPDTLMGF